MADGGRAVRSGAVLDDVPEDTDIFYVLTRKPAMPEMVATEHFMYEIATDGSIALKKK